MQGPSRLCVATGKVGLGEGNNSDHIAGASGRDWNVGFLLPLKRVGRKASHSKVPKADRSLLGGMAIFSALGVDPDG